MNVIFNAMRTIYLIYQILKMMIKKKQLKLKVEDGYRVFFVFVFTDKIFEFELKEDAEFKCKYTGTNCIKHYLIPIDELIEIKQEE